MISIRSARRGTVTETAKVSEEIDHFAIITVVSIVSTIIVMVAQSFGQTPQASRFFQVKAIVLG